MRPEVELLINLALLFLASSGVAVSAMQNINAALHSPYVDSKALELLQAHLDRNEFVNAMRIYARQTYRHASHIELSNLHKVYAALNTFNIPCNVQNLRAFSDAALMKDDIVDDRLRYLMQVFMLNSVNFRYGQKCLDELNEFARTYFQSIEKSNELMSKLVAALPTGILQSLYFQLLKQELNLLVSGNKAFRNVIFNEQYYSVCMQIKGRLVGLRSHMTELIVRFDSLHTPQMLNSISTQVYEQQPNAVRMLILVYFCENFII